MSDKENLIRKQLESGRSLFSAEEVKALLSIIDQMRYSKSQKDPHLTPFYKEVDE
jgi:hypothetical protein